MPVLRFQIKPIQTIIAVCLGTVLLAISHCSAFAGQGGSKPPDKKPQTPIIVEDSEVRLGRENSEENDRHVRLITDAAMVQRVNKIGQELAAIANKTPIKTTWGSPQMKNFNYTFKIVDDKDPNAYSLPGGFIYVHKGLLDYIRSDDELAGVLAHEIMHAAHHHMLKLIKEQNKIQNVLLPALAAAILFSKSNASDIGTLALGTELYSTAKLNTYGIEAEKDADQAGMTLMQKSKYNPLGLYSFMLRLAADDRSRGNRELGIFRTHPPSSDRVAAAKSLLGEWGIPLEMSKVDPTQMVSVTIKKGAAKGRDLAELSIRGMTLCRMVGVLDQSAEERARPIALRLTEMFDRRLMPFEIRLSQDKTKLIARTLTVLTEEDAKAQDTTLEAVTDLFIEVVKKVGIKRQMDDSTL